MSQNPSPGRIVLAVFKDTHQELVVRPAIITRTWGAGITAVQASIFPDATNDGMTPIIPKSSLQYDEAGKLENSWHWPKREEGVLHAGKLDAIKQTDWVSLYQVAHDLCLAIEKLQASAQATELTIKASNVLRMIKEASFPG